MYKKKPKMKVEYIRKFIAYSYYPLVMPIPGFLNPKPIKVTVTVDQWSDTMTFSMTSIRS